MIRGCGRTDFQEGSASTYINPFMNNFITPDETIVYPGTTIKGFFPAQYWKKTDTTLASDWKQQRNIH